MLKRVLAACVVCALPLTVNAEEKPDVAEQLKELAADRERLLEEAPEEDRVALLDAERVLGAQGEKGWEFRGALRKDPALGKERRYEMLRRLAVSQETSADMRERNLVFPPDWLGSGQAKGSAATR